MIRLNMELPPEVARRFVEDNGGIQRRVQPAQEEPDRVAPASNPSGISQARDGKLRLPDVKELFKLMHDYIAERK
jgi:hypothetical protein